MHLMPKHDVKALYELTDEEREELAQLYIRMLKAGNKFFEVEEDGQKTYLEIPYVMSWHQAPVGEERELMRLHMQLHSIQRAPGKLKYLGGSESGMGAWISDTTPEKIADRLREVYEK